MFCFPMPATMRDVTGDLVARAVLKRLVGLAQRIHVRRLQTPTGVYQAEGSLRGGLRHIVGRLRGAAHGALLAVTHGLTDDGEPVAAIMVSSATGGASTCEAS